jgi:hypothetical protein
VDQHCGSTFFYTGFIGNFADEPQRQRGIKKISNVRGGNELCIHRHKRCGGEKEKKGI